MTRIGKCALFSAICFLLCSVTAASGLVAYNYFGEGASALVGMLFFMASVVSGAAFGFGIFDD